jgi:hypothetical protein
VYRCSDASYALRHQPGSAGIPSWQDDLQTTEHGAGAPRVGHLSSVDLYLEAQMSFNAGNRVNNEFFGHLFPSLNLLLPLGKSEGILLTSMRDALQRLRSYASSDSFLVSWRTAAAPATPTARPAAAPIAPAPLGVIPPASSTAGKVEGGVCSKIPTVS